MSTNIISSFTVFKVEYPMFFSLVSIVSFLFGKPPVKVPMTSLTVKKRCGFP